MPPVKGVQPVRPDRDLIPAEIPRHASPRDGRPWIRRRDDPTKGLYYSRASGFGDPVEYGGRLDAWEQQRLVFGLSRSAALYARSQAVPSATDPADRVELGAVAEAALARAGAGDGATRGTAIHTLGEQVDGGRDLSHLSPELSAAMDAYRALAGMMVFSATELFVVWDEFRAAGSLDRLGSPREVWTAPDGALIGPDDVVIVDLKTTTSVRSLGAKAHCQLAVYANGVPYVHVDDVAAAGGDTGRRGWPGERDPRTDWALVLHVPVDDPGGSGWHWVDLAAGVRVAERVLGIREDRRCRPVFARGLPEPAPAPEPEPGSQLQSESGPGGRAVLLGLIGGAGSRAELVGLWRAHAGSWDAGLQAAVVERLAVVEDVRV